MLWQQERNNFLKKVKGISDGLSYPPLKSAKKRGEMPFPILPFKSIEFRDGMGLRTG